MHLRALHTRLNATPPTASGSLQLGKPDATGGVALCVPNAAAGFPCVVVQPYAALTAPLDPLLLPLPPPEPPLLPRQRWCNSSKKGDYGRRIVQFHRMRLWRTLLDRGLNVLGVDAERRMVRNPLPAIAALRCRNDDQYGSGRPPDVLGGAPGWFLKE